MKNFTILVIVLFSMIIKTYAQIPNNGFENWDNYVTYWDPQDFFTGNAYASGSFHPVTRSTDHFPSTVGEYSIRIESKPNLLPNGDAFGVVVQNLTNVLPDGPMPYFPIVGHPTSLTGYYKYEPQDGDTMLIQIILYYYGSVVSAGSFTSTDTTLNWTSFIIDFPNYISADSGTILISAYNAQGLPPEFIPYGNSVLYVDNLNFDELINAVPDYTSKKTEFNLYPNPAADKFFLKTTRASSTEIKINIYNLVGGLIKSKTLFLNQRYIDTSDLTDGIYMVEVNFEEWIETYKLIIQK